MSFKGYASSRKVDGSEVAFPTVEPIRTEQHGLSVIAHEYVRVVTTDAAETGSAAGDIKATAHSALKGDIVRVTSGTYDGYESKVVRTGTDNIYVADNITLSNGDTIQILRHKYPVVAADGTLTASIDTTGLATSAKQDTGNTSLSSIDTKLSTGNTSLSSIDTKLTSQATAANQTSANTKLDTLHTDLASLLSELSQKTEPTDTQPISAVALPLPSGAATESTLSALSAKHPATLGQKAMAASLAVVLASDQSAVPASQSGTWNINNISGTVSLPTGAATETTLSAASAKLPATLGQKAMAASLAVVLASDQAAIPVTQSGNWSVRAQDGSGNALTSEAVGSQRAIHTKPQGNAYVDSAVKNSSTVTSAAWTQLIASTAAECQGITVFDSSGVSLELGTGGAGAESRKLIIPPGGLNGFIPLRIPASTRIAIRAINTTADYTSAELLLTLLG